MAQPHGGDEREAPVGMPPWVKGVLIVAVILLVVVVVLHLNGTMAAGHGG